MEIVYQINHMFLQEIAAKWPNDPEHIRSMSLIDSSSDPHLRMAYLSIVGSYSVNGVAALHTKLLKQACSLISMNFGPRSLTTRPTA